MKKLLAVALVSLATVAANAGPASAWFHCFCSDHCYSYNIHVRPYNAFSPYCFGNISCNGCAPQFALPGCGIDGAYHGGVPYGGTAGHPYALGQVPPAGMITGAPIANPANAAQFPAPPQAPYGAGPAPL